MVEDDNGFNTDNDEESHIPPEMDQIADELMDGLPSTTDEEYERLLAWEKQDKEDKERIAALMKSAYESNRPDLRRKKD